MENKEESKIALTNERYTLLEDPVGRHIFAALERTRII
jgi:hypothetical protein